MAKTTKNSADSFFTADTFRFFRELAANNDRDWFLENKDRYEASVREPFLRFITALGPQLEKINRHFVADPRPARGSLMRIYRDIRFSKDKTPYKTWGAAHFFHEHASGKWQAPEFYLHVDPTRCYAAAGLWHPDPIALRKVRQAIVDRSKDWQKVRASKVSLEGRSASRPPKGFDAEHPFIEDIKRTDFCTTVSFKPAEARAPDFLKQYVAACRSVAPLMKFLTEAVELEW